MAFRGGSGKGYSGGMTPKGYVPKKKATVSYVLRDAEEPRNRSGVNAIRIDRCTQHLYSAGRDAIIRCWDISSQDGYEYLRSLEHHTDWVNDIVLCMNGQYIMSASSDITLKLWDAKRGACTSTLRQQTDYVRCLAYAKEREQVASGSLDHSIFLWDLKTLTTLTATNNKVTTNSLRGQKDSVYSLAMNEAGTVLVAGGTDKVLQVWDPRTDEKLMRLKGHTDNVRTLLLSPDGTTCVSGSSDGTVRLWSLGQQRCIETFRMHEEGVWTLAADEGFETIYSGGRDKKVYAIELSQGIEGSLLFVEDAPVLCLTPDPCDSRESLWVATTNPHINKWTFDPDACEEEEEGEGEGEGEGIEVTDIDDYSPSCLMKKTIHIPGGPSIKEYRILRDRQHVLTRDSNGHVQLWDVLHAVKEADLGQVDIDQELERRQCPLYTPNWFSAEVKTGMLSIKLSENDCFSAWVMGANANLDTATPDLKLNLGALQLRALFEHWPSARPLVTSQPKPKQQQQTEQQTTQPKEEEKERDSQPGEETIEGTTPTQGDGERRTEKEETMETNEKEERLKQSQQAEKQDSPLREEEGDTTLEPTKEKRECTDDVMDTRQENDESSAEQRERNDTQKQMEEDEDSQSKERAIDSVGGVERGRSGDKEEIENEEGVDTTVNEGEGREKDGVSKSGERDGGESSGDTEKDGGETNDGMMLEKKMDINQQQQHSDKEKKHHVPSPSPKLEQVMSECDDVIEWVELGAALHISQSDLDNIEHIHRGDVARCRRELFKLWLKSSKLASWKELVAALSSSGYSAIAVTVKSKYLKTVSVTETPPPSPASSPPNLASVNGANTDKVNIKFFSVPTHTPVIIAESGDCATTLVRLLCKDAGGSVETRQLNNYCPIWVMDIVCQRKLPDHPKMNFNVGRLVTAGKKNSKMVDRLSAQDVISIRKVLDHVYNKMEPKATSEARKNGEEVFEMICNNQVLDLDLDLRTVRYKYWKSGGDMKLYYRKVEHKIPEPEEKEDKGENENGQIGDSNNDNGKKNRS